MDEGTSLHKNTLGRINRRRFPGAAWLFAALVLSALCVANPRASAGTADDEVSIERYAVRRVQPAYPPNAQKYRIEGAVTIRLTVAPNGTVSEAEFVRGQTVFRTVSLDAAKRWVFKSPGNEQMKGVIHFIFKLENDR